MTQASMGIGIWHEYRPGDGEPDAIRRIGDLVRCKDCKRGFKHEDGTIDCHGYLTTTWDYYDDCPKQNIVPPDGFCAWGERKVE